MRSRSGMTVIAAFAIGALAETVSHEAFAGPIKYTFQATSTGSLGGAAFTNSGLVITMNTVTENITSHDQKTFRVLGPETVKTFAVQGPVSVSIAGGAPVYLVGFSNFITVSPLPLGRNSASVAIGQPSRQVILQILDVPELAQYDLSSSFGPVSGSGHAQSMLLPPTRRPGTPPELPSVSQAETGGALIISAITGQVSFTATASTVDPKH